MSEIETNGNVAALGAEERTDFIPTPDERYVLVELNVRKLLRSEYFCGEELDAAALGQVTGQLRKLLVLMGREEFAKAAERVGTEFWEALGYDPDDMPFPYRLFAFADMK